MSVFPYYQGSNFPGLQFTHIKGDPWHCHNAALIRACRAGENVEVHDKHNKEFYLRCHEVLCVFQNKTCGM